MSEAGKGDVMERIERLERANLRWRRLAISAMVALIAVLGITTYVSSQQQPNKKGGIVQPPGPGEFPIDKSPGPGEFPIDKSPIPVTYANFCRVNVTPEELILDLGLNPQTEPDPNDPVRLSSRVVMSFYNAKRLSAALQQVVQQHEATYGPIEVDVKKRVK